jgi:hypothetical protein
MATLASAGPQHEERLAADTKKIHEAFLVIIEKLDDAQSLKRLLTKYERKPYTLACDVVEHYYKKDAAIYTTRIDVFYSELQETLTAELSTLNVEVVGLLEPIIGPSNTHREHRRMAIYRRRDF